MLAGIHQLHYLPWLRYFEKIARSDVFVVLDHVQYNKNGWQNRNRVKTASGVTLLTVPVHAPLGCALDQVRIDNSSSWRKKHWATIRQSYGRCPYFAAHAPFLEETYARQWNLLNDLNRHMLAYFVDALGIETRIVFASDLDVRGEATDRLVSLINAVGADTYYSGAYALDRYLDAAILERAGIRLEIQHWSAPTYPQTRGPFVPDLAVVDLMMNCGPDSLDILLGRGAPADAGCPASSRRGEHAAE